MNEKILGTLEKILTALLEARKYIFIFISQGCY